MIEYWTTDDGLAQHTITSLAQTGDGYLWIGTLGGLARFDGQQFATFDRKSLSLLPSNTIQSLAVGKGGELWVGTDRGLVRLVGKQPEVIPAPGSLSGVSVTSLLPGLDGSLWVGTSQGTFRLYGRDYEQVTFLAESGTVHALAADTRGRVWAGTDEGLLLLAAGSGAAFIEELPGIPIRTLLVESDGSLLAGTEGRGIFRVRMGAGVRVASVEITREDVSVLARDAEDNLWVGTARGVVRYRPESRRRFSRADGLSRDRISALLVDRDGNVWAGTERGLNRLREAVFSVFGKADGLAGESILALHETPSGEIWIGTECDGVNRLRRGVVTTFRDELPNPCVWSVSSDKDGSVWIGTQRGLSHYRDGRFTNYSTSDGLSDDFIVALVQDGTGGLWIGTRRGGLNRYSGGLFTKSDAIPSNAWVRAISNDATGKVWVATDDGLTVLSDATSISYSTADGLSSNDVRALHEDANGVLWIGTYDGGINRYEEGRFVSYSTDQGLADNRVAAIVEDRDGRLWTCGNRGVQRITTVGLDVNGDPAKLSARLFGISDGLRDPECNGGFHSSGLRSSDERIWFPTPQGVAVVDPTVVSESVAWSAPIIELVRVEGESIPITDNISLPRGHRDLEIHYTRPNLTDAKSTRFRYMMVGLDDDWIDAGGRRQAFYPDIAPGSYVFRVDASDDGVGWTEVPATVEILVPAHFHETRAFLLLCLAAIIGTAVFGHRLNTRRLRMQSDRLQQLVDMRTAALQEEKERAEEALLEADAERARANKALGVVEQQAERLLEADHQKTTFFANISHEFRTPLTLIIDPLERALEGTHGTLSEAFTDQLRVALRNARRLLRLIRQLLDLARLDAGSMTLRVRETDLVPFVAGAVDVFSSEARRLQINLAFSSEEPKVLAFVDRDHFEKILYNLIANALKATPAGGKVLVSVRNAEDNRAELIVRDTGVGIPADKLARVFDRYFQVDRPSVTQMGAGIGLSLVKELVDLHHGTIAVDSYPGFGCMFKVIVPTGADQFAPGEVLGTEETGDDVGPVRTRPSELVDAPVSVSERTPSESVSEAAPTVLVVEDNSDMRQLIRRHLEPAYRIIEANDGLEGMRQARAHRPDLVVSDVVMPEMEGVALCRLLKQDKNLSDVPVILLTARASEESRVDGLQAGADDYLVKPFSAVELRTRVENLIRSRQAMRDRFSQEIVLRPTNVIVPSAEAAFLERVRGAVELHLEDPQFGVGMLAAEVGVSESQLKRKLSLAIGQAPVELIRAMRLERAAQLLRQRAGNVGEVAFAVGFQNLPYFTKCFRDQFGTPPSRFAAETALQDGTTLDAGLPSDQDGASTEDAASDLPAAAGAVEGIEDQSPSA